MIVVVTVQEKSTFNNRQPGVDHIISFLLIRYIYIYIYNYVTIVVVGKWWRSFWLSIMTSLFHRVLLPAWNTRINYRYDNQTRSNERRSSRYTHAGRTHSPKQQQQQQQQMSKQRGANATPLVIPILLVTY